jgi:hypothetical protein
MRFLFGLLFGIALGFAVATVIGQQMQGGNANPD